jgi:hypothetical protein
MNGLLARTPTVLMLLAAAAALAGCEDPPSEYADAGDGGLYDPPIPPATLPRVVALGDLHGDLAKTRRALSLAGAIDEDDHWIGGGLIVVQTGDMVDRGPYDREIIDLFERLSPEAESAGGAVRLVLGNHEYRNAIGLMSFVPLRGFWAFFDYWDDYVDDPSLGGYPDYERPRRGAFRPGGPYAELLARRDIVLNLDGTVYVHGSFLPPHAEYGIARMNDEMRAWLLGEAEAPPSIAILTGSPFYSRQFGYAVDDADCATARESLFAVGASRMVIGHSIQSAGINSVCGGRVYRIDTGMSAYYADGPVEVLEITPAGGRVLEEKTAAVVPDVAYGGGQL